MSPYHQRAEPCAPKAGGCGPAATPRARQPCSRPSPQSSLAPGPGSRLATPDPGPAWPLVPGLGSGGSANGWGRARMERALEGRPLLSLWLPLGPRRLYLTAAIPVRTRHMG